MSDAHEPPALPAGVKSHRRVTTTGETARADPRLHADVATTTVRGTLEFAAPVSAMADAGRAAIAAAFAPPSDPRFLLLHSRQRPSADALRHDYEHVGLVVPAGFAVPPDATEADPAFVG